MISEAIERLADRVLAYEETDLTALLNHFKTRMEQFEPTPEWERAVTGRTATTGLPIVPAGRGGPCAGGRGRPAR